MAEVEDVMTGIPAEIVDAQLPHPILRDYYRDEANRIFWVESEINADTLNLVKFIMRCNKEDMGIPVEERKRILVMIDSPGGSVEVLASLIGAFKISKTPIYTCCYCTAYSAAADLLACGHKRYALPMTNMMFHAGSCGYQGTQAQVDSAKKFFDGVGKRIVNEVNSRTNFDNKFLKKLKTDDMYLNEEEALSYGAIDEIISDMSVLF